MEVHTFCDASEMGYCAVAYLVTEANGVTTVTFLLSRVKVAPLKAVSMPRLELLAAELGLKVVAEVKRAHKLEGAAFHFWVNAQDVLAWVGSRTKQLPKFIGHRVAKIQDQSVIQNWRKVPGELNPADVGSRGCLIHDLIGHELWWSGPKFLTENREGWPTAPLGNDSAAEEFGLVALAASQVKLNPLLETDRLHPVHFHSFDRLLRVVARIRGWLTGFRGRLAAGRGMEPRRWKYIRGHYRVEYGEKVFKRETKRFDPPLRELAPALQPSDVEVAKVIILKRLQLAAFPEEIARLRKGEPVHLKSPVSSLNPTLDEEGLV